ncbi:hypothetical protein ARMGADRAFT_1087943 [Armillaria gallica]|uniref:Uncharacterized protein n=1 Tax=Armillaria gallica TaxID=47427 RepID=A0A2H3DC25_ARMGA|nr:hypothetical protein ARMGADRAFT_1087943 [Armillaria gallica]
MFCLKHWLSWLGGCSCDEEDGVIDGDNSDRELELTLIELQFARFKIRELQALLAMQVAFTRALGRRRRNAVRQAGRAEDALTDLTQAHRCLEQALVHEQEVNALLSFQVAWRQMHAVNTSVPDRFETQWSVSINAPFSIVTYSMVECPEGRLTTLRRFTAYKLTIVLRIADDQCVAFTRALGRRRRNAVRQAGHAKDALTNLTQAHRCLEQALVHEQEVNALLSFQVAWRQMHAVNTSVPDRFETQWSVSINAPFSIVTYSMVERPEGRLTTLRRFTAYKSTIVLRIADDQCVHIYHILFGTSTGGYQAWREN